MGLRIESRRRETGDITLRRKDAKVTNRRQGSEKDKLATQVPSPGATLVKCAALSFGIELGTTGQASPDKNSHRFAKRTQYYFVRVFLCGSVAKLKIVMRLRDF